MVIYKFYLREFLNLQLKGGQPLAVK